MRQRTSQQQPVADPYGNVDPLEFDWQSKPSDIFHPSKAPYNPRRGRSPISPSSLPWEFLTSLAGHAQDGIGVTKDSGLPLGYVVEIGMVNLDQP